MKRIFVLLATVLAVQPLWAQLSVDLPDTADPAADVSFAPVDVFTNGPGRIYIFERGRSVADGQMLPVGSRIRLIAVPDPGYEFVSWYPVNVFSFTEVTLGADGNPATTNYSVVASPVPRPVNHHILDREVLPLTVLYDVPGVRVITQSLGWQANFEPIPLSRRKSPKIERPSAR